MKIGDVIFVVATFMMAWAALDWHWLGWVVLCGSYLANIGHKYWEFKHQEPIPSLPSFPLASSMLSQSSEATGDHPSTTK